MNDHRAAASDRGRARHAPSGDPARSYAPGSRLRRALDIARGAADQIDGEPEPAGADPQPAAPPVASDERPSEPAVEPAAIPRAPSRTGLGRGLDALLPALTEPDTWENSAQGWVRTEDGSLEWRPIIATVDRLDAWEVATYVGVVTGRAAAAAPYGDARRQAWVRREAVRLMVEDATARGAHGVLGVSIRHDGDRDAFVVTATGTAVTLVHRK